MAFVIATAWGVRGDVMPYVAVGAELRRRGHEVVLVSNPFHERPARDAGLSFVPVGTEGDYHALVVGCARSTRLRPGGAGCGPGSVDPGDLRGAQLRLEEGVDGSVTQGPVPPLRA